MARRGWDDRWQQYPASKPLPADGIATSKQRGAMADNWWSERFVTMLAGYGLGGRMQRGRRYARSGQVLSVEVNPGMLVAQVQGSRRTPYAVTVRCDEPTAKSWAALGAILASQVRFAAGLVAGEVPPELESAQVLVSGDLPTIWMRPENGVAVPVRSPAQIAKHASGASGSAPAG